jgi:hypothetical protein
MTSSGEGMVHHWRSAKGEPLFEPVSKGTSFCRSAVATESTRELMEQRGDTLAEILSAGQRAYLRNRVLEPFEGIDVLLLSAGGNDIIGPEIGEFIKEFQDGDVPIEERFHRDKLEQTLQVLRLLFVKLIDLCASTQPELDIYAHGYL